MNAKQGFTISGVKIEITKGIIFGFSLIAIGFTILLLMMPYGFQVSKEMLPLFTVSLSVGVCSLITLGTLIISFEILW